MSLLLNDTAPDFVAETTRLLRAERKSQKAGIISGNFN
jgi:hypothetical protein